MVQNRFNGLKTALYDRIKEREFCDDLTLLTWLVSELDEWVERLDAGAFSGQRNMQTDFLGMFMVNIEVIDEIRSSSELKELFPEREWIEFRNTVLWLEMTRDREQMSLVERTYDKFRSSFAAISGQSWEDDSELGPGFDSQTLWAGEEQSLDQDEPSAKESQSQPSQVEWWPRSSVLSPIELKVSRAILSFAILSLLASAFCFVTSLLLAHYASTSFDGDLSVCFLCLSVFSFAVWAAIALWFRLRRKSQE
jgi:hypothetical protein